MESSDFENQIETPNTDQSRIEYRTLKNKDGDFLTVRVPGTSAATAANYGYIFGALRYGYEISAVLEKHETKATDAGAVILDVVKVNDGSTIATGVTILTSTFNLKGVVDTYQVKQGSGLNAERKLKPNQSLALKTTGVLTDLAGVFVEIYFFKANYGSYR